METRIIFCRWLYAITYLQINKLHFGDNLQPTRTCATAAHVRVSDAANQRRTTITRKLAILTYAIGALPLFTNNEFNASAST